MVSFRSWKLKYQTKNMKVVLHFPLNHYLLLYLLLCTIITIFYSNNWFIIRIYNIIKYWITTLLDLKGYRLEIRISVQALFF